MTYLIVLLQIDCPDARNIYQQSLEQVPELLAGAGIGAIARKGATAGARAVINNAVRKAAIVKQVKQLVIKH